MKETNRNSKLSMKNQYVKQGLMFFTVGAALILAYYVVNNFSVIAGGLARMNDILMPFYIGLVMAYLLCPIYNGVTRLIYRLNKGRFKKPINDLRLARVIATIISLAVLVLVVGGCIMMILPDLWESITGLVMGLPETMGRFIRWLRNNLESNPEAMTFLEGKIDGLTDTVLLWAQEKLVPGAEAIINNVSVGVIGTVSTVIDIFVALIICVYVLNSKEKFIAQTKKLVLAVFKPDMAKELFELGTLSNETFGGFINGKIIDSIIIGIICFAAMSAMGLPLAMLISVIVGLTNIIPFFGPFIGAVPSAVILLIIEPVSALKFVIMVLILQQIDGNIIGPKILGKTTKLASFWVMFAIIVSGGLFGFVGMVLGVPVFAIIYTYISRAVNRKLEKREIETDTLHYEDFSKYDINKEDLFGKERFNKEAEGASVGDTISHT